MNKPNKQVLTPTGNGLELAFLIHPADVVATQEVHWQFLLDGKPQAGVKVDLSREGELYPNDAGCQGAT